MTPISSLLLFSTLVVLSHGSALLYGKSQRHLSYKKREKLWQIHLVINGSLWLFLFAWILALQWMAVHEAYPGWMQVIGFLTLMAGLALSTKSRLLLGRNQAMGIRFFLEERASKITHSLYAFLNNPMYDGFILIFISMGLLFGIKEDFYLAVASFVLLNGFLAHIENHN